MIQWCTMCMPARSALCITACFQHRVYLLGGANASGQPHDTVVYYVYGDVAPSDNSGGQRRGLGAISYMALAPGYFWSDSLYPPGQRCRGPNLPVSDCLSAPFHKERRNGVFDLFCGPQCQGTTFKCSEDAQTLVQCNMETVYQAHAAPNLQWTLSVRVWCLQVPFLSILSRVVVAAKRAAAQPHGHINICL